MAHHRERQDRSFPDWPGRRETHQSNKPVPIRGRCNFCLSKQTCKLRILSTRPRSDRTPRVYPWMNERPKQLALAIGSKNRNGKYPGFSRGNLLMSHIVLATYSLMGSQTDWHCPWRQPFRVTLTRGPISLQAKLSSLVSRSVFSAMPVKEFHEKSFR